MNEQQWDQKLKIHTAGLDETHADLHHNRYEPTPYEVLERLVSSGYVRRDSKWIDYGCGKGRVGFFLNHETGCHTIGVECEQTIFRQAVENQSAYGKPNVEFVCAYAENCPVDDADHFYFFNPFSVEILRSVLGQIIGSYYQNPRTMRLFFYYPSDVYLAELMTSDMLVFLDEIDCRNLFSDNDPRERIVIFELTGLQNL